ncbi:PXA domain-domain-containing protein [Protomyces lactucae-debilis]|uniref:PXA domain-domain-containing protein n=1 Tax=Protomyces lactucae-debilis TaxID=2754530 RepID=A0A1Y2FJW7_PROLT|nr:PXA domain-containing protein [Protomyces lactucae-debilis]ORY83085.1 PXA domain-domain-containing protein [Protomyces lactucae-debilis]
MTVTASREQLRDELKQLLRLLGKQYIRSWYTGISKNEDFFPLLEELVDELFVKVCERSDGADWDEFLHQIVPALLLRHLEDFNTAVDRQYAEQSFAEAFYEVNGLHDGVVSQSAYLMRVADGLLSVLLPYEELVSDVGYAFVRELLSDVLLALYSERLSDVYFWDDLLIKLLRKPMATDEQPKSIFGRVHDWASTTGPELFARGSEVYQSINAQHAPGQLEAAVLSETALTRIIAAVLTPSFSHLSLGLITHLVVPLVDMWRGAAIRSLLSDFITRQTSSAALTRHAQWLNHFLFPNGQPSPSRVVPTEDTQAILRITAKEELVLDIPFFSDKQVNKVLLFRLLDAAITTLLPELARQTPEQIRKKRIMIHQADSEAFGLGGISSIYRTKAPAEDEEPAMARRPTAPM